MIWIDYTDPTPIYEQIVSKYKNLIVRNVLTPGEKMPSVRSLAMELSINPNTIQKAYTELDRRGIIVSVPGKGSFISSGAVRIVEEKSKDKLGELKEIVTQLAYAGMSKSEIIDMIEEVYKKV